MRILSPAKINLFLHVLGKRPDGYHEIETLMCCVNLYDILHIDFINGATSLTCTDYEIPCDDKNHAIKAINLFSEKIKKNIGVKIHIEKNIPSGAGLGGGSSNAASVLSALNIYFGHPFSMEEIMSMGLEIGADVPFFIFNQPALATGIGEKLEKHALKMDYKILIVYPGFSVSTGDVYKNLNLGLTNCKKKFKSLSLKQEFDAQLLCNDLEYVTASMYPEINKIKEALLRQKASGVLMSGSGSSVFGLFPDSNSAANAVTVLSQNSGWRLFVVDSIN